MRTYLYEDMDRQNYTMFQKYIYFLRSWLLIKIYIGMNAVSVSKKREFYVYVSHFTKNLMLFFQMAIEWNLQNSAYVVNGLGNSWKLKTFKCVTLKKIFFWFLSNWKECDRIHFSFWLPFEAEVRYFGS